MPFTAHDVADIEFDNAPFGRRGYAKADVEGFRTRIAETLAGQDDLTAADVHRVQFGRPLLGRRGYDEQQVDEFLDKVEQQLSGVEMRRGWSRVVVDAAVSTRTKVHGH